MWGRYWNSAWVSLSERILLGCGTPCGFHPGSILNFCIGSVSSIGGWLPRPCLPTLFPILRKANLPNGTCFTHIGGGGEPLREWQRVGAQKGGFEKPLKTPWFLNQGFCRHFSCTFHGSCAMKMPEKRLKNLHFKKNEIFRGVLGGSDWKGHFQIPPFVPPSFAILQTPKILAKEGKNPQKARNSLQEKKRMEFQKSKGRKIRVWACLIFERKIDAQTLVSQWREPMEQVSTWAYAAILGCEGEELRKAQPHWHRSGKHATGRLEHHPGLNSHRSEPSEKPSWPKLLQKKSLWTF